MQTNKTLKVPLILSAFAAALWVQARAQNYAIDWYTIDGGSGTSTGGVYLVSGTIGQPDAAPLVISGGTFSVTGGFWAIYALQTPDAPLLSIQRTITNTVVVSLAVAFGRLEPATKYQWHRFR